MENLNTLKVVELNREELSNYNGGWVFGLLNLVAGATYFAYQLGKDSYDAHPESLI